jgi:hypothetical protein
MPLYVIVTGCIPLLLAAAFNRRTCVNSGLRARLAANQRTFNNGHNGAKESICLLR